MQRVKEGISKINREWERKIHFFLGKEIFIKGRGRMWVFSRTLLKYRYTSHRSYKPILRPEGTLFFRARLKTVAERFLLREKRETYVFGVNCMQVPTCGRIGSALSLFLRFIPSRPSRLFPVRGRGKREGRSDSVPITVERLNVSWLLVVWTFVFSKLGSIIVNEQTIVAGSVADTECRRYFRKFLRN